MTTTEKLRAEFRRRGMTIKEAAVASGIKPSSLYHSMEHGRIKLLPFLALCQALGLNPWDFRDDPDDRTA